MTNGEKILNAFPNATTRILETKGFRYIEVEQNDKWIADFNIDWWNAEYKELPTKNDLAVDYIDRQATLDAILKRLGIKNETYLLEAERAIYQQILAMPPVTSQEPRWIPVSERLPEKSGDYWCTFGGTNLTGSDYYTTESDAKKIFDNPEEYAGWRSQNVVAWMPSPQAYREVEE